MLRKTVTTMSKFASSDSIRAQFAAAMSAMYRTEVPLYATLTELVSNVNAEVLKKDPALKTALARNGDLERLDLERHGAIRLGLPRELSTMRRIFSVMGMYPVGYYDLSVAGVPVHSTAFRPVDTLALNRNPFRIFTSLLRPELIADKSLCQQALEALNKRQIFTPGALSLLEKFEADGGLSEQDSEQFVKEVLETFRWHRDALVSKDLYSKFHDTHRLVADIVSFKGPHINHLTPRTLDIDAVQEGMIKGGIDAKDIIEGPPRRKCPILLRQTSFKALTERVDFPGPEGFTEGTHTARFGEIEQRGQALTSKGRALYDKMLSQVRSAGGGMGSTDDKYYTRLAEAFAEFPDDLDTIRREGLGYFRYKLNEKGLAEKTSLRDKSVHELVDGGFATADPITYEDFLPVSAAGIFQSNLGGCEQRAYEAKSNKDDFEKSLGAKVNDLDALYSRLERESIDELKAQLSGSHL